MFVQLLLSSAWDEALLLTALRCLASMALDDASSRELRQLGALPLLLGLLACDRSSRGQWLPPSRAIAIAACTCLAQLANDDENAYQLGRQHGLLTLVRLLLLPCLLPDAVLGAEVQAHVLRVLRYLYSVERNRTSFKRLLPSALFAAFVDIGHWVADLHAYDGVVALLRDAEPAVREAMWRALEDASAASQLSASNRRVVRGYVLQEVLGKGAFGTVYRVRKEAGERAYALKEIPLRQLTTAADADALRVEADAVCQEVDILSQLEHPNIVRYYASFVDNGCMYIVMELVDGTSLLEHVQSVHDRGALLAEEHIWPLFIQLVLALSYMHIEKRVVHRDLTSANVMVDPRRRVKVMDLGLALQRRHNDSDAMDKPVGTLAFSCPEIVTGRAYSDKADVWSLGCVLYAMATGRPPFGADNPLAVAQKVVKGAYTPVDASYSPLLHEVIRRLLTVDPAARPDILSVSVLISPLLLAQLDRANHSALRLELELQHEQDARKRDADDWQREKQAWRKVLASKPRPQAHAEPQQVRTHTQSSPLYALAGEEDAAPHAESHSDLGGSDASEAASASSRSLRAAAPSPLALPPRASRVSSMVSVSPTKVREIRDPVSDLLTQLHKLLWVTQLPPSSRRSPKRALLHRYKTALFRRPHHRSALKQEMQNLLSMQDALVKSAGEVHAKDVTYEEVHLILERALREEGYYDADVSVHAMDVDGSNDTKDDRGPRHYDHEEEKRSSDEQRVKGERWRLRTADVASNSNSSSGSNSETADERRGKRRAALLSAGKARLGEAPPLSSEGSPSGQRGNAWEQREGNRGSAAAIDATRRERDDEVALNVRRSAEAGLLSAASSLTSSPRAEPSPSVPRRVRASASASDIASASAARAPAPTYPAPHPPPQATPPSAERRPHAARNLFTQPQQKA